MDKYSVVISIYAILFGFISAVSLLHPVKLLQIYNLWPKWLSEHKLMPLNERSKAYLYTLYQESDKVKERYPTAILAVQAGGFVSLFITSALFCKLFGFY